MRPVAIQRPKTTTARGGKPSIQKILQSEYSDALKSQRPPQASTSPYTTIMTRLSMPRK